MNLLAIGLAGALGALLFIGLAAPRVLSRIRLLENRPATVVPHPYDDAWVNDETKKLWSHVLLLEQGLQDQNLAIAEGIERVARAEARVAETVRRAKRRADAAGYVDPGVEGEVAELQRGDDDRIAEGSVPVLHQELANDDGNPSSVRGVTVEQLQRARGW